MTLRPSHPRAKSRWALALAAVGLLIALAVGSAVAVHADGVFQLDGNAFASDPGSPARTGDDWDLLDDGAGDPDNNDSALVSQFVPDDLSQTTDQIYTGGSTKDDLDTTGWRHTAGSVPDKDNLEHAFAAMYNTCADGVDAGTDSDQCLFFGLDRFARNGDAQVGFWFFKNSMTPLADGTFANPHAVGDILVLSNFTNGGVVGGVQVYKWDPANADTNGTLLLLASEGECVVTSNVPAAHDSCGESNTAVKPSPWFFDAKSGADNFFPQGSFYEGGINLNSLGLGGTCVSSFIAETRSSQSVDAVLKDFAYGEFNVCSANIQVGLDGTNRVGAAHTVTGHVNTILGGASSNAPDGTTITFSKVSGPGDLSSTTCQTSGGTGSCSVTLTNATPGVTIVHASSTVSVGGTNITVQTNGQGSNSDDLRKTWVDAKIAIATSGTNRLGDAHTFTVTLSQDDGQATGGDGVDGWAPAVGKTVTNVETGVGTVTGGTCTTTVTNASGQCTIIVDSDASTGSSSVTASSTFSIAGLDGSAPVTVSTDGTGNNSGAVTKTWVDAKISIATSGTNKLGDPHTFTVTVQQDDGQAAGAPGDGASGFGPAVGVTVTNIETGVGSVTGGTCTTTVTNASGQCTIIVDSDVTTGTSSVTASSTFSIAGLSGSKSVTVSTDGSGSNSGPATKTWVDARITIAADATNNISESHTFTVTVQKDSGSGFAAANGVAVAVSLDAASTAGTITGGTCTGGGVTAGAGQCTVIVQSNVAGTAIVDASATVGVAGTAGSANVAVNVEGYGAYGTIGRTKIWVDGTLRWLKHDGAGQLLGGAVFTVCRTHTFNSDTSVMDDTVDSCFDVYDENDGDAGTSGDADSTLGEFQLNNLVLGRYTIVEKTPPPGYHGDSDTETVNLTIANRSNADGGAGDVVPVFVNTQAYRLIVITCDDISHKLVVSSVDLDGAGPGAAVNSMSAADLAAYNTANGTTLTEAQVCGNGSTLISIGGAASFGDLAPAAYNPRVNIPL